MKAKKIFSAIMLIIYIVAIYWVLSMLTDKPLIPIVTAAASILFTTVVHELGHLIAGLLTGYRFVSYRIFSVMLTKTEGKWQIHKYSLPGTGGLCLMAPPRKKNGYYPFALYNLGGIILCGYLSFFIMISSFFVSNSAAQPLLFLFGCVSFYLNAINAIPTKGKSMVNDATNLRMALKSDAARLALWNQLEYVSLHAQNVRTADMPEELFFMPEKKELSNPLLLWQILANVEREEDRGNYEKAREIISFTLDHAPHIFPLYKSVLQCEAIYLDCILKADSDDAEEYYEKLQKIPALRNLISFHRASYAYLLLRKQDSAAAEKALSDFQKKIKTAPYAAEAEFEQTQLAYIQQIKD